MQVCSIIENPFKISLFYSLIDLTLDIDDMTEKLPEEYKVSMEDTLQKHFEYQFHSADYHTVLQIITGLKTVLGHLIKVSACNVVHS